MNNQKKGRTPISQKSTENSDFAFERNADTSILRLDPALKKELNDKGLVCKWISLKDFQADGNFHKRGFVPYKFESLKKSAGEFSFGSHPEGYLIRRELILAVLPKEEHARHKRVVKKRTDAQSQVVKRTANEIRQSLGSSGAEVYEGYEANGGTEGDD